MVVKAVPIISPHWTIPKAGGGGGGGGGSEAPSSAGAAIAGALSAQQQDPRANLKASGIIPISFGFVNLGANVNAAQGYRVIPDAAFLGAQLGSVMVYRGSIVAMALMSNAALSAGRAIFEVYLQGVRSGAQLIWTSLNRAAQRFAPGDRPFNESDVLDVRATTTGFAPTSADIEIIAYVTFEAG